MIKSRPVLTHTLAAVGAITIAASLGAGRFTESTSQPDAMGDMQAAMEKYMESIKPGDKHKVLERFVGDWTVTTRLFMSPDAPPMETTGTCSYKMVLGGRYVQSDFRGKMQFPGPDGKLADVAHDGICLMGFDNNRKLFNMIWIDTMGTGVIHARGGLSQDGKTLTMFGDMDEPMTGEIGKPVRYVNRFVDPDTFVLEISEVLYGDPFKVVEVEFKRKK